MRSGKLRHRVTIEQPTTTKNTSGESVTAWTAFASNIAADIDPLSAREYLGAQALQSNVQARITIRYRPGITAAMRIVRGAVIYNIAGVLPDAKSGLEYITIPVSTGVNQG